MAFKNVFSFRARVGISVLVKDIEPCACGNLLLAGSIVAHASDSHSCLPCAEATLKAHYADAKNSEDS